MSDYNKRASLLDDIIRRYCNDCERRKNADGKTVYALGDAPCRACDIADLIDDIENYPAADVCGMWIPVTKRLPKKSGAYLVIARIFDECPSTYIMNFNSESGVFGKFYERFHSPIGSVLQTADVLYWMPLPEPPEVQR